MIRASFEKALPAFTIRADFSVNGATAVLMGESGSGKTTILECIAGISSPDRGEIFLDDRLVFSAEGKIDLPPRERRVGYVFQDYALFPHLSALDNVALALGRGKKAKAADYLERFGLSALSRRKPGLLSGGERQRLALARALATEPKLLLLDEPFSALDRATREETYREFLSLRDELGMSVLLVTHSRTEAELLGHRILEVGDGLVSETSR
jgi:molybdate transport system ATP-binding protein